MRTALALISFTALSGCSLDDTEALQEAPLSSGSKHCAIRTTAVPADQDVKGALPSAERPQCFSAFADVIGFVTEGRVALPEHATPADLDRSAMNALATFVIGIEYEHPNETGSSYTFYSNFNCASYNHYVNPMPAGWNDRVSSSSAWSYCNHSYHYEHTNFTGAVIDCGTGCYYVGDAMNDRTTSIFWTQ